jgi:hypothetical protein
VVNPAPQPAGYDNLQPDERDSNNISIHWAIIRGQTLLRDLFVSIISFNLMRKALLASPFWEKRCREVKEFVKSHTANYCKTRSLNQVCLTPKYELLTTLLQLVTSKTFSSSGMDKICVTCMEDYIGAR